MTIDAMEMQAAEWQEYPASELTGTEEDGAAFDEEAFSGEGAERKHELADEEQEQEEVVRPRSDDREGDAVINMLEKRVAAFVEESADFDEALHYLAQKRDRQLAAHGVVDHHMQDAGLRQKQMKNELLQIINVALQRGENPARMIYAIACGYGFQQGRGKSGSGMTLKKLVAMSEQEFNHWYEKNGVTFRKLMGG